MLRICLIKRDVRDWQTLWVQGDRMKTELHPLPVLHGERAGVRGGYLLERRSLRWHIGNVLPVVRSPPVGMPPLTLTLSP
jgi:hypothetical protein